MKRRAFLATMGSALVAAGFTNLEKQFLEPDTSLPEDELVGGAVWIVVTSQRAETLEDVAKYGLSISEPTYPKTLTGFGKVVTAIPNLTGRVFKTGRATHWALVSMAPEVVVSGTLSHTMKVHEENLFTMNDITITSREFT